MSHNGLTGCETDGGDWALHKLKCKLGGMFDVTHNSGLTLIWSTWARQDMYKNCFPRFKEFAVNVVGAEDKGTDEKIALAGIKAKEEYDRLIGMPVNIGEPGIFPTVSQTKKMTCTCSAVAGGHAGSAMILHVEDMFHIYKGAL